MLHTSSILKAQIGKSPNIAQSYTEANIGENGIQLAGPLLSSFCHLVTHFTEFCKLSPVRMYATLGRKLLPTSSLNYVLKLNTMQLVTPGGNHCCLMANDVQN